MRNDGALRFKQPGFSKWNDVLQTCVRACVILRQIDVLDNRLLHATYSWIRDIICKLPERERKLSPGHMASDRQHDGALRLDNAPPVTYFNVPRKGDAIHTLSFHPVHAEPGEVVSTLILRLDVFTPASHRLFIVSVSSGTNQWNLSLYRCTVLFVPHDDIRCISWAETHLTELDMSDNPILMRTEDPHDKNRGQWSVARRFHRHGQRDERDGAQMSVIVTAASDVNLRGVADPIWLKSSKIGMVR